MKHKPELTLAKYDPNLLLDSLIRKFKLKNDADLARLTDLHVSVISKLRHRRAHITPGVMICLHESTGMSLRELRALMGDNRHYYLLTRASAPQNTADNYDYPVEDVGDRERDIEHAY